MIRFSLLLFILTSFLGCQENNENTVSDLPRVIVHAPKPVLLRKGESTEATLRLEIKKGFHVQANPVPYSYLIPTELTLGDTEGVSMGLPLYPAGMPYSLYGSPDTLSVYEGVLNIRYTLSALPDASTGEYTLEGIVIYQTCDDRMCFPPVEESILFPVRVY